MPTYEDLVGEISGIPDPIQGLATLQNKLFDSLKIISISRKDRNVIFYSSSFLEKPTAPNFTTSITPEDINGFMSMLCGMQCDKGLTLILHTPGGITNAAETIGDYLISKFKEIEIIIPVYAMSAGTMLSFISQNIIMGRQSQLGPIDPQMPTSNGGRFVAAKAIIEQFNRAKTDIASDTKLAHLWAPILQSLGPALLAEAEDAMEYGDSIVARWLEKRMFGKFPTIKAKKMSDIVAKHFSISHKHKSHGTRIDRDEARQVDLTVEDLEASQSLQDAVLTAYHLVTIIFQKTPATKLLVNNLGKAWVKNHITNAPMSIIQGI